MKNERKVKLQKILKEVFGYSEFRFEQERIIHSILDKKDTLAIMPTGGGKSLCYQIPALFLPGITLVISPLISLMQDQVMNLKEYGIRSVYLNSALTYRERELAKKEILEGKIKIIYVSPEGILGETLSAFFQNTTLSLIAIDEAHCVSQWGHEFRKDYIRLGELKDLFPGVTVAAFTATADAKTRQDIQMQLKLNSPDIYISSFDRPNINYMILERSDEIKQLDQFIKRSHLADTGIVYCLSRDKVDRVTESLKKLKYNAISYHAGMTKEGRRIAQSLFNTEEKIIVVATIAFGMGIDRPDVRFVAHLDLPKSIESYYQETGRAGRDGKPAEAWMIYGLQDVVKLSQMLATSEADEQYKKIARHKLDSMLALCETGSCRRQYLLQYFGEELKCACGNCDTCFAPPLLWDATIDAQKILSTILRTKEIFGAGYIIDVLRGSKNTKITDRKHDALSVYGIGKDRPKEHWDSLLRQLLNLNYVVIKNWDYRSLGVSSKAQEILKKTIQLNLRKQEFAIGKTKTEKRGRLKKVAVTGKFENKSNENLSLYDKLKALRNKLAKEKSLPSYIVFNDKSLHDMCAIKPRNESEFLLVYGVGQNKLANYGKEFLGLINEA